MEQPKVSVIVPVYNAEPYIERCVRSLFGQTLGEMEYIFIDDCTPDNSIEVVEDVLKEFPERKASVHVLRNEKNMGVSFSRQRGVDKASGEYIIHCDPDDWVELDAYSRAYETAKREDSDILIFGYRTTESPTPVNITLPRDHREMMDLIINGLFDNYLWNRLVRSEFIRQSGVKFNPELSLWEDQAYLVPLMFQTDRIAVLNEPLYIYNCDNPASISKKMNLRKTVSKVKAVAQLDDFFRKRGLDREYSQELDYWKASVKYNLIRFDPGMTAKLWREAFPEVSLKVWKMPINLSQKIKCTLAWMRLGFLAKVLVKHSEI